MKKFSLALLALATALAISSVAKADSIGVTATSGVTFNGSGVTSGTGTVEGGVNTTGVFTSLVGDSVTFYAWSSSLSSPTVAYSTDSGLVTFTIDTLSNYSYSAYGNNAGLFAAGNGVIDDNGTYYDVSWTASGNTTDGVTYSFGINSTVTPEPSNLLLLGTGLLGLAFVAFRKAKSSGMVLNM